MLVRFASAVDACCCMHVVLCRATARAHSVTQWFTMLLFGMPCHAIFAHPWLNTWASGLVPWHPGMGPRPPPKLISHAYNPGHTPGCLATSKHRYTSMTCAQHGSRCHAAANLLPIDLFPALLSSYYYSSRMCTSNRHHQLPDCLVEQLSKCDTNSHLTHALFLSGNSGLVVRS